ncbi:MAG: phosphonopyruvate decarboxylase [Devosia sp.]|uniref:phosphonopyruvate decarboxylase n=1 Tax=Devosia sp. TaxID=1871048 RepID=UPI0024C9A6FB|nr:phosphonopyruvate decarboxylase [Devosia sp.]UYO00436.1 MAG: phosphonopyruvate decarboxylase [Devosia sp.]
MISPQAFYEVLSGAGVNFLVGVPDSLLKEFCAYVDAALPAERHLIAANEGTAMGIAAGVHLATGGLPMVYLQNSGLGNTVNPLLSLADPEVYGIPMIVLIGWRGEPGVKDEPQHVKQGRVSVAMLDAMEVPYKVLDGDPDAAAEAGRWAAAAAIERSGPVALLVRKGAFGKAEAKRNPVARSENLPGREEAIGIVTQSLPQASTIVSTTGMISRELYEQRVRLGQDRASDFLTVGSMGHASQIALGIALTRPDVPVVCIDGDGAALMHLGGMASIGVRAPKNFVHIVLNNGVHDSVGGQPTVGFDINLCGIAKACGYKNVEGPLTGAEAISEAVARLSSAEGPSLIEIHVRPGSRADLGRPKETPAENKALFVGRLKASA